MSVVLSIALLVAAFGFVIYGATKFALWSALDKANESFYHPNTYSKLFRSALCLLAGSLVLAFAAGVLIGGAM